MTESNEENDLQNTYMQHHIMMSMIGTSDDSKDLQCFNSYISLMISRVLECLHHRYSYIYKKPLKDVERNGFFNAISSETLRKLDPDNYELFREELKMWDQGIDRLKDKYNNG